MGFGPSGALRKSARGWTHLLIVIHKFTKQHVDVHVGWWRRPVLDQWGLIIVQQVHVIIRGRECRGGDLLLYPPLFLCRDHQLDGVEVHIRLLLSRFFPHLLHPHPLDPPPLAGHEAWRTQMRCQSHPRHGSPQRPLLS
jgi:hypothetical protein